MKCNICGSTTFKAMNARPTARCASCGSTERTRLLWLYLEKRGVPAPGARVLHLAPERGIYDRLKKMLGTGYYEVADFCPENYKFAPEMRKIDLCELESLESNAYDLILHSHVLEHVMCNIGYTLFHLHRALKPTGSHVCIIPFLPGQYDETYQDIGDEERTRRFGQHDHVRRFGRDDVDKHIGKLIPIDPHFDATKDFSEQTLLSFNIPRFAWKGLTPNTITWLSKYDMAFMYLIIPKPQP